VSELKKLPNKIGAECMPLLVPSAAILSSLVMDDHLHHQFISQKKPQLLTGFDCFFDA
jgi:hypothetical protein